MKLTRKGFFAALFAGAVAPKIAASAGISSNEMRFIDSRPITPAEFAEGLKPIKIISSWTDPAGTPGQYAFSREDQKFYRTATTRLGERWVPVKPTVSIG